MDVYNVDRARRSFVFSRLMYQLEYRVIVKEVSARRYELAIEQKAAERCAEELMAMRSQVWDTDDSQED